jgi:hypothetical protein
MVTLLRHVDDSYRGRVFARPPRFPGRANWTGKLPETAATDDAAVGFAEPVAVHFLWRPQLRDPCDEMVLETAVNGRAAAIVTFNERLPF